MILAPVEVVKNIKSAVVIINKKLFINNIVHKEKWVSLIRDTHLIHKFKICICNSKIT
jgi:hypothetical protein